MRLAERQEFGAMGKVKPELEENLLPQLKRMLRERLREHTTTHGLTPTGPIRFERDVVLDDPDGLQVHWLASVYVSPREEKP